ncbi:hypothetical protein PsYK624_136980 [Phanerochaete sordida]|uniref:F-box domain-containing protein n=1 Tax=Phanerochaete sordida TaxID=48140 RepID=A0A9P3GL41_9APHY|nr:hypothetical protein PsYK624_136980 [Phanerochaete sordida]
MHRCLRITEVVQAIADDVRLRSDLLSMGLACRTFFDPAMNEMWRYLPAPEPLIRLLPEHVRGSGPDSELKIVRRPSREDWKRFEQYARKVWELEYWLVIDNDEEITCLDIDWTSILRYYPGEQLLPNLRRITTDQIFLKSFCPLVIRSPLRRLTLDCIDPEDQQAIVPHLHKCAATLETLSILASSPEDEVISDEVSCAISHLQALTHLAVGKLLASTVEHLSQISSLSDLSFTLDDIDILTATMLPFSRLQCLSVETHEGHPGSLVSLLRRIEAPSLRQLTVVYSVKDDHVIPGHFYPENQRPTAIHVGAVLAAAATFTSLQTITYDGRAGYSRPALAPNLCAASTLRPLFALPNLEAIKLVDIPFILMPNDIEPLAQAWPKLSCLLLGNGVRGGHSFIQAHDLLPFASCPDLRALGLQLLIVEDSTGAAERPAFGALKSRLRTLNIGDAATVEYSPDAVAFLACAFPDAWLCAHNGRTDAFRALQSTKEIVVDVMKKELALRGEA